MADDSSSFLNNKWRHHDITSIVKDYQCINEFLFLSDTFLFNKFFSPNGYFW